MAKKKESFFFIPPTEQAQVSVPVFTSGRGRFDPNTNKPINEAGTVVESQARGAAGMLGQGGQVSISPTNRGRTVQATGRNLGAMGFMDSEIIAAIQMNYALFGQYQIFARQQLSDLNEQDLLYTIQKDFYQPLFQQMSHLINTLVPRDSGRLRNAMELALGGGHYGGTGAAGGGSTSQIGSLNPFYVILNTGKVPYAPVVNRMPDNWLQHFGMSHRGRTVLSKRTGRRVNVMPITGKHTLYDPQAIQYWYHAVRDQGRYFAYTLWNRATSNNGVLAQKMQPIVDWYANPQRGMGTPQMPVMVTPTGLLRALFAVRFN